MPPRPPSPPPPLRVAALQLAPPWRRPALARRRLAHLFEAAGRAGAHLAVAPEMATSGYLFPSPAHIAPFAEDPLGPTFQRLAPIARRYGMWLVYGFPERSGGAAPPALYNAAAVVDPTGALALCYRKTHLFEADTWWATPGTGLETVTTPWGALAVGICRDLVEDAFVAELFAAAPPLFAYPTNWVPAEEDPTDYWAERLKGYGGIVIAADRWGSEAGVGFAGCSQIRGPGGVLARMGPEGDGIIVADVTAVGVGGA